MSNPRTQNQQLQERIRNKKIEESRTIAYKEINIVQFHKGAYIHS